VETTRVAAVSERRYDDEIDLLRYGRFLSAYWSVLAAGAAAGALAALAIGALLPARYQSTATLALTPQGGPTPVVLTPASAKALVASYGVVSETLKETGLDRTSFTSQSFVDEALDVRPVPSTNLVRLSVTLADPAAAQRAASLLATKIVAVTQRIDREGREAARNTLDREVAGARAAMEKAEQELLAFQTEANVEKLEADARAGRATPSQRTELYRKRLAIERFHAAYLERARGYADLFRRQYDLRARPVGASHVQIVDAPRQPDQPLPRRRTPLAVFGALVGTVGGVIASLLLNRRRIERPLHA
jgi:uncharacterized protein involved in exopolysaccharide biosynthesis